MSPASGAGLDAHFVVRRPDHETRIDLEAPAGEVIALIGPNGAGKSTTLRAVAGLVALSEGSITINGRLVADGSLHVAPHLRRTGVVFQDHLLFPHLSVRDNVAFGPRAQGLGRRRAGAVADHWMERLDLVALAARRPSELSGGEAQRAAVARALASDPDILLLDEPTASLDATAAMTLRSMLREHLHAFAGVSILVTHTALDAMVVADRLLVLDGGRIVQSGAPGEVAARPRTRHAAALVGLNLVEGTADAGVVTTASGARLVAAEPVTGPVFASFPPAAVSLFRNRPEGSPRNVWLATVGSLAPHGDAVRVQLDAVDAALPLIADITANALGALVLTPGDHVWAAVKATEVSVYER